MKGKIFGIGLLLLCFGLLAFSISAIGRPVEVERIANVCFVRVKGAHHAPPEVEIKPGMGVFLLHYENIYRPAPNEIYVGQRVNVQWSIGTVERGIWFDATLGVREDKILTPAFIGSEMDFTIKVYDWDYEELLATISGSVDFASIAT